MKNNDASSPELTNGRHRGFMDSPTFKFPSFLGELNPQRTQNCLSGLPSNMKRSSGSAKVYTFALKGSSDILSMLGEGIKHRIHRAYAFWCSNWLDLYMCPLTISGHPIPNLIDAPRLIRTVLLIMKHCPVMSSYGTIHVNVYFRQDIRVSQNNFIIPYQLRKLCNLSGYTHIENHTRNRKLEGGIYEEKCQNQAHALEKRR